MISIYMHTLNGKPAAFDGRQVCYLWEGAPLVASLRELRRQQTASAAWRSKRGHAPYTDYGYRRLLLPEGYSLGTDKP